MADSRDIKEAPSEELLKAQPLMDVDLVKKELLDWLAELRFPVSAGKHAWDDCIKVNRPTEEEQTVGEGHRIRVSLTLHTRVNHYLILIIENLAPDSREVFAISVHVRWQKEEWQMQRHADANYKGEFTDIPKARHTLWAQNFRIGQLHEALNACAVAILGHELVPFSNKTEDLSARLVRPLGSQPLDLPTNDRHRDSVKSPDDNQQTDTSD